MYSAYKIKEHNVKQLLLKMMAALLFVLSAQSAWAVDGLALAKANNCLLCHGVDKKVMGPAYKDVAEKYKGDKSAKATLVAKVKAGGSGVWGNMPMPPNSPQVNDEDITAIVQWILSL